MSLLALPHHLLETPSYRVGLGFQHGKCQETQDLHAIVESILRGWMAL